MKNFKLLILFIITAFSFSYAEKQSCFNYYSPVLSIMRKIDKTGLFQNKSTKSYQNFYNFINYLLDPNLLIKNKDKILTYLIAGNIQISVKQNTNLALKISKSFFGNKKLYLEVPSTQLSDQKILESILKLNWYFEYNMNKSFLINPLSNYSDKLNQIYDVILIKLLFSDKFNKKNNLWDKFPSVINMRPDSDIAQQYRAMDSENFQSYLNKKYIFFASVFGGVQTAKEFFAVMSKTTLLSIIYANYILFTSELYLNKYSTYEINESTNSEKLIQELIDESINQSEEEIMDQLKETKWNDAEIKKIVNKIITEHRGN